VAFPLGPDRRTHLLAVRLLAHRQHIYGAAGRAPAGLRTGRPGHRPDMRKLQALGIGAVLGGVGAYVARRAQCAGRGVGARVTEPDDTTLTHTVESTLYRAAGAVKGRISVNTADGVVQLRGEVDSPDLIGELVARARAVPGVRDVENLLHTPGSEAPMHQ
jgi:BON domain